MRKKKIHSEEKKEFKVPWYVWGIVIVVIVGVVFYVVFSTLGTVNYNGMIYKMEKYGEVIVYKYSYSFIDPINKEVIKYNLYVRNNPKKNDMPFNADIVYPEAGSEVKLIINGSGLLKCEDSSIAVGTISQFLVNNGFKIKVATTNMSISRENNITYATCETHPYDFMLYLGAGEQTQVSQQRKCYKIEAANCEILKAVEKFMVESVAQARDRARNLN